MRAVRAPLLVAVTAAMMMLAPAALAAAPQRGTVLRLDTHRHVVELATTTAHAAQRLAIPTRLARGLRLGSIVQYRSRHGRVVWLRRVGQSRRVVVTGRVVRQRGRLGLQMADGQLLTITLPDGTVIALDLSGFQPGQNVTVSITINSPTSVTVAVHLGGNDPGTGPGCTAHACQFTLSGSVSAIGVSSFTLNTGGQAVTILADPDQLSNLSQGEWVRVRGHRDSQTGDLWAAWIEPLPGCDQADCSFDVVGTVDAVDQSSFTLVGVDGTSQSILASADQLAVLSSGNWLEATGNQDPITGDYTAAAITPLPGCGQPDCTFDYTGNVTDIAASSFTLDDGSGNQHTIAADAGTLTTGEAVDAVGTQDPHTGAYTASSVNGQGVAASHPR